jgi:hypothetical protein
MSGAGVKQVKTPTEAASMYDLRSWRCEAPCFAEQVSRRRNIGQYAENRAKAGQDRISQKWKQHAIKPVAQLR